MKVMKKITGVVLGLVLTLSLSVSSAFAAEFRVPETEGGNITVSETEEVKNLYTGGNLVSINADVEKSLYVGGNVVTVIGNVEDNLLIGGGTVTIQGDVGGTVHAGGGTIIIEGAITDDLFVGGGTVTIAKSASIGGDLIVGGGVVSVQGPVKGNVYLGGGQATLNSSIGGFVMAETESLNLGKNANIGGDLSYKSVKELTAAEGAVVSGETTFNLVSKTGVDIPVKKTIESSSLSKLISIGLLTKLLVSMTTGLVIIYIFGKKVQMVTNEALKNFRANLGLGFAALISLPFVAVILLITVVGVWLAGLTGAVYSLMLLLASLLATIIFGSWLMKLINKGDKYVVDWKAVVLGVLGMSLLGLLPPVGWLVKLVFVLISLGSLYRLTYRALVVKK